MSSQKLKPVLIALAILLVIAAIYKGIDSYLAASAKPIDSLSAVIQPKYTVAPPFELRDLNGQTISPEKFKNKVIIVNFWASWCAPCVEEFPSLLKLIEAYKEDVVLLALSGDNAESEITGFLKNYKLEGLPMYTAWDADGAVARLYGTSKLPESYIFKRGNLFHLKIEGIKNWQSPAFMKTFESLVHN